MRSRLSLCAFGAAVVLWATSAADALPPNFIDQPVAGGWNQAVGLTFASDGRMFVWEKGGSVWNVENGVKAASPLIDLGEEVGDWRDYGLLGFALDPNFYGNGHIYLLYVVDYHHLIHFGTPAYDPLANQYFHDTLARLVRYTCNAGDGYRSVNYASRLVLIGESISTGFPICHQSHGIGSLAFAADGTLLATCGDGASYETTDLGGPTSGSSNTCLADGIIRPKEDIGAYRSQLVDCLSGKIVRLDPATGNGVPSNPYYDVGQPRSARSRVWALGLRNPFRFTIRPGTGSANPAAGNPGAIYIGDVGWNAWEELNICRTPRTNFGWPAYEGMTERPSYYSSNVANLDAPNPLFGVGGCVQPFFYFRNLIVQDTLNPPSFPNPCNMSEQVPPSLDRFLHRRPVIDWGHGGGPARVATFSGNIAAIADVGGPGSPVQGPQFGGNSSTGGVWYTGTDFPVEYQNTYFHGDYAGQWIRNLVFDAVDNPTEVREFGENGIGAVVGLATDPANGGLYYINYNDLGVSSVRRISWVLNVPPNAVASATPYFGPAPLPVQFTGDDSSDPDAQPGDALTFEWDFGDGTPISREANPVHVYPQADITDDGTFVALVFSFSPPEPTGGGNHDPEVMRDGDYPPIGNQDSSRQYDTYHGNAQGAGVDWVGYEFAQNRLFRRVVFQEGKHFSDGGWFGGLTVHVRVSGVWTNVTNFTSTPAYPGNNGVTYETFELTFDPMTGDGIRIYGNPGGSANFISVGELRVIADPLPPVTDPTLYNVTLTVTDELGGVAMTGLIVSLNNTPPSVTITSPPDGSLYSVLQPTQIPLTADISDVEHTFGELTCTWQITLHHDEHIHPEPFDNNCSSSAELTPIGCDGHRYFYEAALTVSDPAGLSTTQSVFVHPNCNEAGIPTVSQWGLIALAGLLGTCGTLVFGGRRKEEIAVD